MSAGGVRIDCLNFEGSLEKQGKLKTWSWKKYWFVLDDDQLAYFKDETRTCGAGLIDLGQAQSVRCCNSVPRNFSFEIVMKDRAHVLCADSHGLRDRWLRMLQQARLLRPRRSSSMFRPRCNSISDEEFDPKDILCLEHLEPPDVPTTPPASPASPAGGEGRAGGTSSAPPSPGRPKAADKTPAANSPKSGWKLRRLKPAPISGQVTLCSVKPLQDGHTPHSVGLRTGPEPMAAQEYALKENSIYRTGDEESNGTGPNGDKRTKFLKRASTPNLQSSRDSSRDVRETCEGRSRLESEPAAVHAGGGAARARAVSGSLSRTRPVCGERPAVQARCSMRPSSFSTSSEESDSSGFGDNYSSRSNETWSSCSSASQKSSGPAGGGTSGPMLLRRALTVSKNAAYRDSGNYESSESDPETGDEEVFCENKPELPVAARYTISSTPLANMSLDEYSEYLTRTLKKVHDPIPTLTNPRLELTFRSAFDDIRLFLANNREDDEVYPVPRQSERGGRAIKKLKTWLNTMDPPTNT